ncbi:MAG: SAM-dependent chlorinase/fluorinase [Deltaproteobacteria bacterium]|nr:SAM-dependent chlorinase/fluorinase [Deltaproteobacteria bacterium]
MKRGLTLVLVVGIFLVTCTTLLAIETDSAIHDSSSASGMVRAINPEWGNIDTDFMYPDLERLGITKGNMFTVQFEDKSFKVIMATTYDDVQQGEWVAFITPDGFLRIARNVESAVDLLGCKPGDRIVIKN